MYRRSKLHFLAARFAALLLMVGSEMAYANEALARQNNCMACHAIGSALVGPSYKDVAAKYKGDAEAAAKLIKSIREGGTGKWGQMAMPPQSQLSEANARKLATWVLGLK